jgi:hypothetical protein
LDAAAAAAAGSGGQRRRDERVVRAIAAVMLRHKRKGIGERERENGDAIDAKNEK